MKSIKYFFEAIFIYLFFIISKLIGLTLSRKLFSFIFKKVGPIIKSNKIINKNLLKLENKLSNKFKKDLIKKIWSNYGITFIEYIFLKKFRNNNNHINIVGEEILDNIVKN
ncbi:MAG: lipid A biosynthesis acyltransferase, partial [Candidatus Pelagibacter sp.]